MFRYTDPLSLTSFPAYMFITVLYISFYHFLSYQLSPFHDQRALIYLPFLLLFSIHCSSLQFGHPAIL